MCGLVEPGSWGHWYVLHTARLWLNRQRISRTTGRADWHSHVRVGHCAACHTESSNRLRATTEVRDLATAALAAHRDTAGVQRNAQALLNALM